MACIPLLEAAILVREPVALGRRSGSRGPPFDSRPRGLHGGIPAVCSGLPGHSVYSISYNGLLVWY